MFDYKARVTNVVDGDTMDVMIDLGFKIYHNVRIRLAGIDTPEIFKPSCKAEKDHGLEALEFVKAQVLNKVVIVMTQKDATGKYGRYIADIRYRMADVEDVLTLVQTLKDSGFEKRKSYKKSAAKKKPAAKRKTKK